MYRWMKTPHPFFLSLDLHVTKQKKKKSFLREREALKTITNFHRSVSQSVSAFNALPELEKLNEYKNAIALFKIAKQDNHTDYKIIRF